ncbi:hypothetical protein EMA8858_04149 [Emticicia aquatica]|uniref:Uncharacterized protein n=1 Tax=Emticicia aquatica TaxID=1681835 RepID=A0ABN8F0Z3_9BACT|nr:hypothetical protein [Emticicia aquatica]CAH0998014.1 hypothetical protein EMA8858_04149 [Emticicia aquatica]
MITEITSRKGREVENLYPIQQKFINAIIQLCESDRDLKNFVANRRTGKTEALISLNYLFDNQPSASSDML